MPRRRFTLIEMLVVVALISLLAALLMPSLQKSLNAARRTLCMNNQKQMGIEFGIFSGENRGCLSLHWTRYIPIYSNNIWDCRDGINDSHGSGWSSEQANSGGYGGFAATGKLYFNGGLRDGAIAFCPVDQERKYEASKWPTPYWGKPGCPPNGGGYANTSSNMGYYVRPVNQSSNYYVKWTTVESKYHRQDQFAQKAILTEKTTMYGLLRSHKDGMNVLYGDGGAKWVPIERFFDDMMAINNNSVEYEWWPPNSNKIYSVWNDLDEARKH